MSESATRVRINWKLTAKGQVQPDITAEAPTPEEADNLLRGAIDKVKVLAKEEGREIV